MLGGVALNTEVISLEIKNLLEKVLELSRIILLDKKVTQYSIEWFIKQKELEPDRYGKGLYTGWSQAQEFEIKNYERYLRFLQTIANDLKRLVDDE
jgi:hypothetical protein